MDGRDKKGAGSPGKRERNEDAWRVFGCGPLTGKGVLAVGVQVSTLHTDFSTYSFLLAPVLLGPV